MRRAKRIEQASEKAKELMSPEDYTVIMKAITEHKPVIYKYTDRYNKHSQYRMEYVDNFVYMPPSEKFGGGVYLYSIHRLHKKGETYFPQKIEEVKIIKTVIEAMVSPSIENSFWKGDFTSEITTPL